MRIELEAAKEAEEQRAGREALGREQRRETAQPGDPGTAAAAAWDWWRDDGGRAA